MPPHRLSASLLAAAALISLAGCGSDSISPLASGFLGGTSTNHEIGVVVNSTGRSLTLFQLGSPTTQQQIPLGTSSTVTPTGLSVRGQVALVPLGNAASVALVNLATASVLRYFTFASGNTTGSAFVDDTTYLFANPALATVGRATKGQPSGAVAMTVQVAPQPTALAMANGRAVIVSANLDANYSPIGNGVVTIIDPKTLAVLGTVSTGGTNSSDIAIDPDGLAYVVNTGDYLSPGSITIVNPATAQVVATVGGMGVGPGAISIDGNGLAYVSGYYSATVVWNTKTRTFVRDATNPLCAPVKGGACRGAFGATADASGNVYQLFFGDPTNNLPPYAFVYRAGTFALTDSVSVGVGPSGMAIRSF